MKPVNTNLLKPSRTLCAAVAALCVGTTWVHGAFILQDLGSSAVLQPETAGQTIDLFINNTGGPTSVGSFELWYSLNNGVGPAPQLSISGPDNVNLLVPGSPFASVPTALSPYAGNTAYVGYFSVVIGAIATPAVFPTGVSPVARLTLSTVGLSPSPGPWTFSFAGSDLYTTVGDPLGLQHNTASLSLVPEPAETVAVSALLLGGLCVVRNWNKASRKAAAK